MILTIRVSEDGTCVLSQENGDSVWPDSEYATRRGCAARVLQLLDMKGPIYPQSWPEVASLGEKHE